MLGRCRYIAIAPRRARSRSPPRPRRGRRTSIRPADRRLHEAHAERGGGNVTAIRTNNRSGGQVRAVGREEQVHGPMPEIDAVRQQSDEHQRFRRQRAPHDVRGETAARSRRSSASRPGRIHRVPATSCQRAAPHTDGEAGQRQRPMLPGIRSWVAVEHAGEGGSGEQLDRSRRSSSSARPSCARQSTCAHQRRRRDEEREPVAPSAARTRPRAGRPQKVELLLDRQRPEVQQRRGRAERVEVRDPSRRIASSGRSRAARSASACSDRAVRPGRERCREGTTNSTRGMQEAGGARPGERSEVDVRSAGAHRGGGT